MVIWLLTTSFNYCIFVTIYIKEMQRRKLFPKGIDRNTMSSTESIVRKNWKRERSGADLSKADFC